MSDSKRAFGHAGHRRFRGSGAACALLCAALGAGCGAGGAEPPDEGSAASQQAMTGAGPVLSDAEKQAVILRTLEAFVPRAESFFRTSDLTQPNTGRYDAVGSGVTQPRGAGNIAFAYVTLFAAHPERTSFAGIPREVLVDHTIQSIRHEAFTNALSGAGYNRWGNGTWQASLETYSWAFAAWKLWDVLDDETRALVRRVVTAEANILNTKFVASGEENDTGAEDNAWNSTTPALAAVQFPDDPNVPLWKETAKKLALNASSTAADRTSGELVDGKPLAEWMVSVNLHPDLTLENHGFFNPIYQQVTHVDIGDAAVAYGEAGEPVPEAFDFRAETIWEAVLRPLIGAEGDFVMPAGQDWTSKDFQHLEYLGILATRFGRADASLFESRALELVARRQALQPSGSMLGQPQIGYETMLVKRLAALYWHHLLFGPSPTPTPEEFQASFAGGGGVRQFPYSDFIVARTSRALVTMSWDPTRPMGLVVPDGEANLADPIFSYYAPGNLLGDATGAVGAHRCACDVDRFSTAGSVGARRFSLTAFPDGVTLLLDRGTGSTFTYSLDDIPGLLGPRPIWSSAGSGLGALPGTWVNAADRIGMIVRGGGGIQAQSVAGANPTTLVTGSSSTGSGHRGALLLPLVTHEETAALDAFTSQPAVPDDWSALQGRAPDGSVRLAFARFGGAPSTKLALSDERGAPVPVESARLAAGVSEFAVHLELPASRGETLRYFVSAPEPLRGRQDGEAAIVLENPGGAAVTAGVSYVGADGTLTTGTRKLAAHEQAPVRPFEGALVFAGPELEQLVEARAILEDLIAELQPSRPHHSQCRRHGTSRELEETIDDLEDVLAEVRKALDETRSPTPNPERAAKAIERALDQLDDPTCSSRRSRLPSEVRAAIRAALERVTELLSLASDSYGVTAWLEPLGLAQTGEPLTVRVHVFNRGDEKLQNGSLSLTGPAGWGSVGPVALFSSLGKRASAAGDLTIQVPGNAEPLSVALLRAELSYRKDRNSRAARTRVAETTVTVSPAFSVTAEMPQLPLAAGGANIARFRVANLTSHALALEFSALLPAGGASAETPAPLTIAAESSVELPVQLRGLYRTSGAGEYTLEAATLSGVVTTASVTLRFSDDLAQNALGAPFPKLAGTNQAAFPPSLAQDADGNTFWVSDGTVAGQGPTPTNPVTLTADLGVPSRIASVVMVPRVNFGPRAYTIEVSNDDVTWSEIANVPNAANGTVTTTFAPVTTRYVRLRMTASYDRIQPPRNVQVASFIVRGLPFEADLAVNTTGASFPRAFAISNQAAFPPSLAVDGNTSTFWVSNGTVAGQGPSPANPQWIGTDFGEPKTFGTIVMVPRVNFGPTAYTIEVSDDQATWTPIASVPAAPNAAEVTSFEPVTRRFVRLLITGGYDATQPPRNVQVASLVVLP
ncbi:MAG TPA: discoidin domain-containing protein [Polyangiaceae bacterium]